MQILSTKRYFLIIISLLFQLDSIHWKLEYIDGFENDVTNKVYEKALNVFSEDDKCMGISKICFKPSENLYAILEIALNHYSGIITMNEIENYLKEYAESHKKDKKQQKNDIDGCSYIIEYSKPIYSYIDDTFWIDFTLSSVIYSYKDDNVLDFYVYMICAEKDLQIQYKIGQDGVKILNTFKYEVDDGCHYADYDN